MESKVGFEVVGGKLAGLLAEPGVTDLLVNGHGQVWLQRGGVLSPIASPFESEYELAQLAQEIIASGGRHLDQANPFADVSVGGLRVHAAIASGCNSQTLLSIRVHSGRLYGLKQLFDFGMFDAQQLEELRQMISRRESFLIAGPTGSGKTTLLRAMLAECANERIIALEDVAELNLQGGHFISLQTRQANIEGRGEITLDRLVREALRMRPDRLAVGEVRGVELLTMLQALNTGHSGAGATIHANSVQHVAARVNAIGVSAGISEKQLASQLRSAFSWVLQVQNRKLVQIAAAEKVFDLGNDASR